MTNDQSTNLEKLIQQASQGNADAQFNLGVMYDFGQGVPQGVLGESNTKQYKTTQNNTRQHKTKRKRS